MAGLYDANHQGERLYAAATTRNRDVIFDALSPHLGQSGTLFEVASGTGEHAAHMAPMLPNHHWQPSDIDSGHLASINAWRTQVGTDNFLPARRFNVLEHDFHNPALPAPLRAILAINLIHIAPWIVAETLISKAGAALKKGGFLFLYGPYKRDGAHTAPSNEHFDASLKSRNENWGVRDMEAVVSLAEKAGFGSPKITAMPANNFALVFPK